jgi:hypothetical protein
MAVWLQNLVVFLVIGGSLYFVGSQLFRTFHGKRSRVGSCCAQGCPTKPTLRAHLTNTAAPERVVFIPVENLMRRR